MLSTCLQIAQNPARHSPKESCLDWFGDQLRPEATSNWYRQTGGMNRGAKVGTEFCTSFFPQMLIIDPTGAAFSGPWAQNSSSWGWSDQSQYRSCFGVTSVPSSHLKEKKKKKCFSVNNKYPHLAGLPPSCECESSSRHQRLAANFLYHFSTCWCQTRNWSGSREWKEVTKVHQEVPGWTVKPWISNHSFFALRNLEHQTHLHPQQAERTPSWD